MQYVFILSYIHTMTPDQEVFFNRHLFQLNRYKKFLANLEIEEKMTRKVKMNLKHTQPN